MKNFEILSPTPEDAPDDRALLTPDEAEKKVQEIFREFKERNPDREEKVSIPTYEVLHSFNAEGELQITLKKVSQEK